MCQLYKPSHSQSPVNFTLSKKSSQTDSTFSLSAFSDQSTKLLMNLMNVHQEHQEQTLTTFPEKSSTHNHHHRIIHTQSSPPESKIPVSNP
jgi:hypothetical protein